MSIKILRVVREFEPNEECRDDLSAYVELEATCDDKPICLATMVGVQPHEQGTCRAAGGDVMPFLDTWWADASDWQDVPSARMEEAKEAIARAARRLWRETMEMREVQP